ncbi:hypothetical protein INS49_010714 [Diaporthe citri]|uniref:uncharacterized protein n=1 Tax=Diaporthe citri TaxID=83186 RepID=UPI001C824FAB|nr:uncharacterized protein INS49_010714 [Diaporthe citri]KAG6362483.1 hypothetical protein INS49_010714 [Diaporthe citri]
MAASSSTEAQRVTFGIELEFLVPYLWSDEADPEADTDERQVIRLSQEDVGPGEVFLTAHDRIKNILRDFLRPALFAEPSSFDDIKRVVSLLTNNFRLRINETTGFHVHVGMGSHRLPPRALHPPERMLSQHCPTIRHGSHLAQGYNSQRFNYNLIPYDFQAGDLPMRMTVEFREATGSLHPSWVAAWGKTCSRIVEFCLDAEETAFADLIQRLLEAELAFEANREESHRYDVIDLLNDLGLRNEARLVEQKILLGDRNVFWFPCTLEENSPDDPSGASIMVPSGNKD